MGSGPGWPDLEPCGQDTAHAGEHAPWFWLGWGPRGPAGSLRFARGHSELHSGEVSIHPLKDRVKKRGPQRHLSEAVGRMTCPRWHSSRRGSDAASDCRSCSGGWRPTTPGEAPEGRGPSPGPTMELAGTHLGPCFYLSPAVQQEPHHDHVAPAGGDVQWRDAVLKGRTGTRQDEASRRQLLCSPCPVFSAPAPQRQQCRHTHRAYC